MYWAQTALDDVMAAPGRISAYYAGTLNTLVGSSSGVLAGQPAEHLKLAFCSQFAYDLKPYGASTKLTLAALLAEPSLDCDNYCLLAVRLFELLCRQPSARIVMQGWNAPLVGGSHAQLLVSSGGQPGLLLDPTCGLIAKLPEGDALDVLTSGVQLQPTDIVTIFARADQPASVAALRASVANALVNGLFRASHQLYTFSYWPGETLAEKYAKAGGSATWPTPQAPFI
jgi:hypothetical protein